VVLEGQAEAVDSMVEYCRSGPGRAEVARLDVTEEKPEGLGGFQVR
jgi:acylphosphatase